MAHTELKNLSEKGAKLLILVPGAGLEPARTRQSPRDFKSRVSTNSTIRAEKGAAALLATASGCQCPHNRRKLHKLP